MGGRAKTVGVGSQHPEVKAYEPAGVRVLAELSSVWRSQEAHQRHGPALLLESSLKHGEGLLISLKKLDLVHSLAGNSKDRDPREGG